MKSVILAGCQSKKLDSLTNDKPKALVKVTIGLLSSDRSVDFYYSVENEPLDIGSTLKKAEELLRNKHGFIVMNDDIIINLNPTILSENKCIGVIS
jgi:NDP-sugar pyrophosphorylase family protein